MLNQFTEKRLLGPRQKNNDRPHYMNDIEKVASDIQKLNETIYVPRHEYQPIDARLFRHLDLNFYDQVRDAFVENITLKGTANDFQTFIRFLTSEDYTVGIGLYHPKPKFWLRLLLWILRVKVGRTVDCETELSTGGYIVTSNAAEAGKLNPPPGFDMKFFPVDTDHNMIFQSHRQRLQDYLARNPGVRATTMRTPEDALGMQHRMQAAKAAFRKGIGGVTEDELRRLGADSHTAAEIKQAMNRSNDRG
jgi:hypothetical protein